MLKQQQKNPTNIFEPDQKHQLILALHRCGVEFKASLGNFHFALIVMF